MINTSYSSKITAVEAQLKCPITLRTMTEPHCISPCGHSFDGPALHGWLQKSQTCPLDRKFVQQASPDKEMQQFVNRYTLLKSSEAPEFEFSLLEHQISQTLQHRFSNIRLDAQDQMISLKARVQSQKKGLYLLGTCQNNNCYEVGKNLLIHRGMGQFSINKEVALAACPCCEESIQVEAIAIQGKDFQLEGQKGNGDHEKEAFALASRRTDEVKIISSLSDWKYLEIEVGSPKEEPQKKWGVPECLTKKFWLNNYYKMMKNF